MSVTHRVFTVDPVFLRALAREPALLGLWRGTEVGDLGIDPKRFVKHERVAAIAARGPLGKVPSIDDGLDLDRHLPGLRWLLGRARPEEGEAWGALVGEGGAEFPVTPLGRGEAYGFAPFVVRRLAAQLEMASARCHGRYDGGAMNAAGLYPQWWTDPDAEERLGRVRRALTRAFDGAARKGQAMVVEVLL